MVPRLKNAPKHRWRDGIRCELPNVTPATDEAIDRLAFRGAEGSVDQLYEPFHRCPSLVRMHHINLLRLTERPATGDDALKDVPASAAHSAGQGHRPGTGIP